MLYQESGDDELYTICMHTQKYSQRSIELGNILLIFVRSSCGKIKNIAKWQENPQLVHDLFFPLETTGMYISSILAFSTQNLSHSNHWAGTRLVKYHKIWIDCHCLLMNVIAVGMPITIPLMCMQTSVRVKSSHNLGLCAYRNALVSLLSNWASCTLDKENYDRKCDFKEATLP